MTDAYENELTAAEVSVGDRGPAVVVENLERRDFVKYAGASGDFNPIHYDEPHAKAAGYDGVFAQGMLTAGIAAHAVADWFGLANVRRFSVRFQAQVWPGDTVTAVGEVIEVTTESERAVVEAEVRVTNQNDEVVLTGEAVGYLPRT